MEQESLALDITNTKKDDDAEIISFKMAKLLQFNKNIKKFRKEVIEGVKKELKELDLVCKEAKTIIGEFNGTSKGENS